ncbi:MAG: MATE family efflux transporter [Psychromonas sp.]
MITQVATQAMGFADTAMAGRVSPVDLAAIALGTSLWLPVLLLLRGLIMALTPVTSFHRGAKNNAQIAIELVQMLWIVLVSSIILIIYLNFGETILTTINVAQEVIPVASNYAIALTYGVPGIALFYTLNAFCEGMNNTKAPMVFSIIGLLINLPINYILIYGKLGFPAFGAVGSGIATSIVYWLMSLMLFIYIKRHHDYKNILQLTDFRPKLDRIWAMLKLGLPIGINIAVCGSIFAVIALLIGRLGAANIAAAQIALSISSMTYVIPMSLSFGITIRVGYALGRGDEAAAILKTKVGIINAALISLFASSAFIFFPELITSIYTKDPVIAATATTLLWYTALYQMSDALQTSISGALRAYKDTKVPMLLACTAYWGIALPLGVILSMTDIITPARGESGFWIAIITGLTLSAVLVFIRLIYVIKQRNKSITAVDDFALA